MNRIMIETSTGLETPALSLDNHIRPMAPRDFREAAHQRIVLDIRAGAAFAAGHVPGAVCIGLDEEFEHWAKQVAAKRQVLLVADEDQQMWNACTRLARSGVHNVIGWLAGGMAAWNAAGLRSQQLVQISVFDLHNYLENGWAQVLDVRQESGWLAGHIAGAHWHSLENFGTDLPRLDEAGETCAIHCDSGHRSLIAASLMLRTGMRSIAHVIGGFDAWIAAGLPVMQDCFN